MKYRQLRNNVIKVSYNMMGEPSKKRINIGNKRLQRSKNVASQPAPILAHTHSTDNSIRESQSDATLKVIRTIHILRDILFGKVFRDIISSKDTSSSSLSEILTFFCQTSFGATSIAQERQSDLFHAILAHQRSSSFLRVMKRLLSIPGIVQYSNEASAIYFEVWCWLIQNDILANEKQDVNIEVSTQNMLGCMKHIGSANGNRFSPQLRYDIEQYLLSQGGDPSESKCLHLKVENLAQSSSPNRNIRNRNNVGTVKVDDVLEGILQTLEKHDKHAAQFEHEIFYMDESMTIAVATSECITSSPYDDEANEAATNNKSILVDVKALLSNLVAHDVDRTGFMELSLCVKLLIAWYESCWGLLHLNRESMERILLQFESVGRKEAIDYIDFFGLLYTFTQDEALQVPHPNRLEYYVQNYRGTEQHHLICIQNYVQCARLKLDKLAAPKHTLSIRERIIKSRRSISRMRPQSSDFLSKWIVATSSMPGVTLDLAQNWSMSQATTRRRSSSISPKTPLYVTEPHLNIRFVGNSIPLPKDKLLTSTKAEDRLIKRIKKSRIVGEHIDVRFLHVEPIKEPPSCLDKVTSRNERSKKSCIQSNSMAEIAVEPSEKIRSITIKSLPSGNISRH